MVKRRCRRQRLKTTGHGRGVVNHAGTRLVADLADQVGLTAALSAAMAPTKQRRRGHDRGEVLVDVAVMLADGGTRISDLATLRDQPSLFGEVASHPTVWRTLQAVDAAALERIKTARADARAKAWAAGADPGFYVVDVDATLVGAHSEKEHAAPTYKRGFGFHPLLADLDATGEALAGVLRPGNAGSGTAADHVTVLVDALAQLPVEAAEVNTGEVWEVRPLSEQRIITRWRGAETRPGTAPRIGRPRPDRAGLVRTRRAAPRCRVCAARPGSAPRCPDRLRAG